VKGKMKPQDINEAISAIEYEWKKLSNASADDTALFVSVKATVLKMKVVTLRAKIMREIEIDKEYGMTYQKLYNCLKNIGNSLHQAMVAREDLDNIHKKNFLSKIKEIEPEIKTLKEYLTT
jgi:hypothetical protein